MGDVPIVFPNALQFRQIQKNGERPTPWDWGGRTNGVPDAGAFQSAINDGNNKPGFQLFIPGGYSYAIEGGLDFNSSVGLELTGDGRSTVLYRAGDLAAGRGMFNIPGQQITFRNFVVEGMVDTPEGLEYNVDFNGVGGNDPLANSLTQNTSFWIKSGAQRIKLQGMTIQHTGGYAVLGEASSDDIRDVTINDSWLMNNRPSLFGVDSGDLNYGSWNGGILMHGDGRTGLPWMVRGFFVDGVHLRRCTGNGIWSHLYGFESLHENFIIDNSDAIDQGLDFILIGGVNGFRVGSYYARRVGYISLTDAEVPGTPKWLSGLWATGVDTAGLAIAGYYGPGTLVSCNGGYLNLDGFAKGLVSGNVCRTPRPTDPEYVEDQIGDATWAGKDTAGGKALDSGLVSSNTNNLELVGDDILIEDNTFINNSGMAIGLFAGRRSVIQNNYIDYNDNPFFAPILLGNIGSGPYQQTYGNTVRGNKIRYNPAVPAPCIAEFANGFVFTHSDDPNNVVGNEIVSPSGTAYEFMAATGSGATAYMEMSTREGAVPARSSHVWQRDGYLESSALKCYYREAGTMFQHMQLQAYWKVGERGPLLNLSEGGVGGVYATGPRTTSVFSDAIVTGKLYGDAFLALTDTTFDDADADLLDDTVALLKWDNSLGTWRQSVSTSAGARVWSDFAAGGGYWSASGDDIVNNNPGGVIVYNDTPTTGVTFLRVKAGAGQDATPFEIQNNAGDVWIYSDYTDGSLFSIGGFKDNNSPSIYGLGNSVGGLGLGDTAAVLFSSDSTFYGTKDVAIRRSSAGVLDVWDGSGTLTNYRDLRVRNFVAFGTAFNAIQTPGGVSALSLVATRNDGASAVTMARTTGTPYVYGFGLDGSNNFFLRDETAGAFRLTMDTAGLITIGSTVAINQAGAVSITGVYSSTGASGGVNVITATAFNAIQVANGGFQGKNINLTDYVAMATKTTLTPITGDSFTGNGLINFDSSSGTKFFFFRYGTGSTTYTEAFLYGAGLAATDTNFDSIQTDGGMYANGAFTTDQILALKTYASSGSLFTPSGGYGAFGHKAGAEYWYWNGSAWASINLLTAGGVVGTDTQVIFNDGGSALAGDAGLTYNKTTDILTVAGGVASLVFNATSSSTAITFQNSNSSFSVNWAGDVTAIGTLNLESAGITNSMTITRTSVRQYGFAIDGSGNFLFKDISGGATRMSVTTAGLFTWGSAVQIDQAGAISASGVISSTGASGGVNVTAQTATNSIQTVGGINIGSSGSGNGVYRIAGTTVIDASRNATFVGLTFGGSSALVQGSTTRIDSSGNATFVGLTFGASSSFVQGSTTRIDSSGNATFVQLTIGGSSALLQGATTRLNSSGQFIGVLFNATNTGTNTCYQGNGGTFLVNGNGDISGAGDINMNGVYKMDGTTIINSAGAFVGSGVDVGANGISCGNYNVNGGFVGRTVTVDVALNGGGNSVLIFRAGVITTS